MAKVTIRGYPNVAKLAQSNELAAQLEPLAENVLRQLRTDSNKGFVASLRKQKFVTTGRWKGRVSWQIGAEKTIGLRVEAKRGVFARAIAFLKG